MSHFNRFKSLRGITLVALLALVTACANTANHRSTGQVIDDTTITTKLKSRLLADDGTDGLDIDVEVNRGRVLLTGFADSEAEIERATEIANGVSGVNSVSNKMRVAGAERSAGQYVDDKALVGKVNAALAQHPDVSTFDINVEVNNGVVSLGGFVDSEQAAYAAQDAAKTVQGVKEVDNNLVVR